MKKALVIFAKVEAKADQIEFVQSQLLKLIPLTLKEAGCLQYELHQDNTNKAVFMFHEIWETPEHLQAHASSAHFQECMSAIENAVNVIELYEMTKI